MGGEEMEGSVMKSEEKNPWHRRWAVPLACILFSGWLLGQAAGPAEKPDAGASEAPAKTADAQANGGYIIGPEDILAINVWKEPDISRSVPVRSDGAISLPLVGEVEAGGKTTVQLEQEITVKLRTYISEPVVAVMVQEMRSKRFNVLGQVAKPGSYLLTSNTTVLDAIAMAGGFRDFAKQKSIYVLRKNPDGSETRLPFNYKDAVKGKNVEQNVKLLPRDSVVVP
jgi:polysaccharide export outer membrane protein